MDFEILHTRRNSALCVFLSSIKIYLWMGEYRPHGLPSGYAQNVSCQYVSQTVQNWSVNIPAFFCSFGMMQRTKDGWVLRKIVISLPRDSWHSADTVPSTYLHNYRICFHSIHLMSSHPISSEMNWTQQGPLRKIVVSSSGPCSVQFSANEMRWDEWHEFSWTYPTCCRASWVARAQFNLLRSDKL